VKGIIRKANGAVEEQTSRKAKKGYAVTGLTVTFFQALMSVHGQILGEEVHAAGRF
jgi:hypothetical protein